MYGRRSLFCTMTIGKRDITQEVEGLSTTTSLIYERMSVRAGPGQTPQFDHHVFRLKSCHCRDRASKNCSVETCSSWVTDLWYRTRSILRPRRARIIIDWAAAKQRE